MNKNNNKMLKKALCLIFAFLFSINSFAAVVSDNDGSAFITKAEFDSLKNDFQSQIDSYNTTIDNKIDTAIASYLAGVNIGKQSSLITPYFDYKIDDGQSSTSLAWYGGTTGTNITTLRTDENVPNNLITTIHNYRLDYASDTMNWSNWSLNAVWEYTDGNTEHINRTLSTTKKYVDFLVCNKNQNLQFFAKVATNIYQVYFSTQFNVCDMIAPLTSVDKWSIYNDWGNAQRMLHARAETAINSKLLTAVCPLSTTAYHYIEQGADNWAQRNWTIQNFENWYTKTKNGGTIDSTCPSLYSINGLYWYETASYSRTKKINEMKYQALLDASPYNAEIKYGVYLTTITQDNCKVQIDINVTKAGTIKLRTTNNKGVANASIEKLSQTVTVGRNTLKLNDLDKDTNIFIVYAPSGSGVGYIDDISILQEVII